MSEQEPNNSPSWWKKYKEVIFATAGLVLIGTEFVNAELRGGSFHYEFLACGVTLCLGAVAWWGDKRS